MFDTYKIIAIENENTVLINYGLNDGAKEGDVLRIIEPGEDLNYRWCKLRRLRRNKGGY